MKNYINNIKQISILIFFVVFTSSCMVQQRFQDFTIMSTKSIDMTGNTKYKIVQKRSQGEDLITMVILPFGTPNLKEAIDRSIENLPGAIALTNVVLSQKMHYFLLFGKMGFVVTGNPVIDASKVAYYNNEENSNIYLAIENSDGTYETKSISQVEYNKLINSDN